MFSLEGKKALITGASRGIGKEIAKVFHENGAEIAITARSTADLEKFKDELGGVRVHIFTCDVSNKESIAEMAKNAEKEMGQVDILVNNAGITKDKLFMRMSDEDWESVINTNLNAAFYLSKAFIMSMMKQRFGRIINMSSVVGAMGQAGQVNYAASKAGLIGFTKALSAEVAERGITVNAIAPGFIDSSMTENLTEEQKQSILNFIPMKKYGKVSDVASVALFLASNEASYITGQTIHTNGGMLRV